MLYILDQRLRAQNIPADKAKKGREHHHARGDKSTSAHLDAHIIIYKEHIAGRLMHAVSSFTEQLFHAIHGDKISKLACVFEWRSCGPV